MNQINPVTSQADVVEGTLFSGNLRRASLLAGELATRQPRSQQARKASAGYPQSGGAIIYRRSDGAQALGNMTHMDRGVRRDWWHWPTIAVVVTLAMLALLTALSDSGIGDDISLMLRKLI